MARTEPAAAHGWFPDPDGSGQLRMWDGRAWTKLTKYPSAEDTVTGTPAPPAARPRPRPSPSPSPMSAPPASAAEASTQSGRTTLVDDSDAEPPTELAQFVEANRYTLLTIGVAIVYIIFAAATGFIYAALLPIGLSVRAYQLREPSAPVAALAAVAVVVVSLVLQT